ncbi:hypothetical protein [Streptomyces sp. NBC_00154]|uniref:hypothetical protein n=1 Tax=Streptomyces sp. NBC_00154 TaxID=2975670 RepID=UPI002259DBA9|nr:hypothetical protein [Streptomyces sp. NBC_00154]MCX5314990.1 hypothetical protein [Streptomyces sp. NBC_00154]
MGLKDSVTGGHLAGTGPVPRPRAAHVPAGQKIDPASMATQALDGLRCGLPETLADDCSRQAEQSLATQPAAA